ncbi:hypothetical protein ABEG18_13060 [Alsobacter sp. KACC 23698]|uniref:Uncharacterized protein n=1 Tax=Alsobacter sp. KACC 23698 TaxID=3149229 RepID=A0AAU7JMJ7_9HYPH
MQIRASIKVQRPGDAKAKLETIAKGLRGPSKVKVGFPAGKAPGDLISIAYWNHFGTSRGIPPRPFITTAMFKGRGELRSFITAEAKKIVFAGNPTPMRYALQNLGMKGQDMVQMQILSNMPPPNAPSTVQQKGSSRTLVDTGRLVGSVTWAIDTKL